MKSHTLWPSVALAAPVLLACCAPQTEQRGEKPPAPTITNRLDVPPEVIGNLGITFERATRGRLGVWRRVPGELEVLESARWTLRAPARARVLEVLPQWTQVAAGQVVVQLEAPSLLAAHRDVELARKRQDRAEGELSAARSRLTESDALLEQAQQLEAGLRKRWDELERLSGDGNPLTAKESIDAQKDWADASRVRLEAAMTRDELRSRVATKELELQKAKLAVREALGEWALLHGSSLDSENASELPVPSADPRLALRAPGRGIVVELLATQSEHVEAGAPIARIFDTSRLRFHGHLPEGELGILAEGQRVRLSFPSKELPPREVSLRAPIPFADESTRMVHVEAFVPNEDGALAHGLSVMAHVQVDESAHEEVLVPLRCVVFDGLEAIVFKRDPDDPNVVIRTPVALGLRAAARVEVLAGVLEGDELVADGVHQLRRTGLGKAPEGGHFHADGTWHGEHK